MDHFFDRLPVEITRVIFSYMTQNDCLECLSVCKQWFVEIPRYATTLWCRVNFDSGMKKNLRLLQCLGPHVKNVIVPFEMMGSIWDTLDLQCCTEITDITITSDTVDFEDNTAGFINPLKSFDMYNIVYDRFHRLHVLVKLDISLPEDISLLGLARACPPQLTFLTVYLQAKFAENQPAEQDFFTDDDSNNMTMTPLLPRLAYLTLDDRYRFSTRIVPLLRQCPNLRVLELSNPYYYTCSVPGDPNNFDFVRVLELCPYLYRLACRLDNAPGPCNDQSSILSIDGDGDIDFSCISLQQWPVTATTKTTTTRGLSHFVFSDDSNSHIHIPGVLSLIQKTQSTLTVLEIEQRRAHPDDDDDEMWNSDDDDDDDALRRRNSNISRSTANTFWPDLLRIRLPRLKELTILSPKTHDNNNKLDTYSLCEFISSSPHLTKIAIEDVPTPSVYNRLFIQTLSQLRHLQCISFHTEPSSSYSTRDDASNSVDSSSAFLGDNDDTGGGGYYPLLALSSSLQQIHLWNAPLSDQAMAIFGTFIGASSRLKKVILSKSNHEQNTVSAKGLLCFIDRVCFPHQEHHGNFSNGSITSLHHGNSASASIRDLSLHGFTHWDDTVMDAFGNLPGGMRSLTISPQNGVTHTGLRNLVDKLAKNNRRMKLNLGGLTLEQQESFTSDGLQYAKERLGRNNLLYYCLSR